MCLSFSFDRGEIVMAKRLVVVRDAFSHESSIGDTDCSGWKKLTDESQSRECDINVIVDRFLKTGVLPEAERQALYGDFTSAPDFRAAMDIVNLGIEQFEALDAAVRKRFHNDPAEFLEFCENAENAPEMEKLGLLDPDKVAARKASVKPPEASQGQSTSPSQPSSAGGQPAAS